MNAITTFSRTKALMISSDAFGALGEIPRMYTCEGINISPPVSIAGLPDNTKSLALIVEDPDAPDGTWTHWVMWNIAPTRYIGENETPGIQGINDFGVAVYGGPCPPSGSHHYHFKVYAIDCWLDLPQGSTRKELEFAMDNHIVGYGELVGRYMRTRHHTFA